MHMVNDKGEAVYYNLVRKNNKDYWLVQGIGSTVVYGRDRERRKSRHFTQEQQAERYLARHGFRDLQNAHGQNDATVNLRLTGYNRKGVYCPSMKLADKWHFLKDAPFKISEQCCDVMKKEPMRRYQKETGRMPIVGTMCVESQSREKAWLQNGCNAFDAKYPQSRPMSFWTENDVLMYLFLYRVPYAPIYGEIRCTIDGEDCPPDLARDLLEHQPPDSWDFEKRFQFYTTGVRRTGCMFCAFGAHLEKCPNRFQKMRETHPEQYDFCMRPKEQGGLGMAEVLDYIGIEH